MMGKLLISIIILFCHIDNDNIPQEEIVPGLWNLYFAEGINHQLEKVIPYGNEKANINLTLDAFLPDNFICGIGHENMKLAFTLNQEKIKTEYLSKTARVNINADIGIIISERVT